MKRLRILMCAYACDPSRGSEPGNGWNWAKAVAGAGVDVVLLTAAQNRKAIEGDALAPNLSVVYVHSPRLGARWPNSLRTYANYVFFMHSAYSAANRMLRSRDFDLVHHTTWGGIFFGTSMRRLRIPLILGPVGGAQTIPPALLTLLSRRQRLRESVRALSYRWLLGLSGGGASLQRAEVVVASSAAARETARRYGARCVELMPPDALLELAAPRVPRGGAGGGVRVLWVGRAQAIKGLPLAIAAFAQARNRVPNLSLTVVGGGSMIEEARAIASATGVLEHVDFQGQQSWVNTQHAMRASDIFLFTSLRDTFGAQVLEAMGHGLPVVALAHHGIGDHCPQDSLYGIRNVSSASEATRELAQGIATLAASPERRKMLSETARSWAATQTWESRAQRMTEIYYGVTDG